MSKPLTGAILGILTGLAAAVFMARQGIWPPDQITVFFIPGVLGLIGLLDLSVARELRSAFTLILALLILVPMLVWGAFGLGTLNDRGQLNGGCEVTATSSNDSTTVTDTSRSDPFTIDPNGVLSWTATSPAVFQDYEWKISVIVGGIPITVDSGTEPNSAGDLQNGGEIEDVGAFADSRGIDLDIYRGVYEVGGKAASCDGKAFVEIEGEGLDPIALIALIVAITLFVVLVVLSFVRGQRPSTESEGPAETDVSTEADGGQSDQVGGESEV